MFITAAKDVFSSTDVTLANSDNLSAVIST